MIFIHALLTPITQIQKKHFLSGITDSEKKSLQLLSKRVLSFLQDTQQSTTTSASASQSSVTLNQKSQHSETLTGKRKASMAECTSKIVIDNEEHWSKWKENKCTNFERPSSKICEAKKRDEKKLQKISGLCAPLVRAKAGEANDPKNGRDMVKYLRYPKEQIDANGNSVDLMPA